jgi:diadenosine tetraphosphate (Ap4A) HIT family hydrolase
VIEDGSLGAGSSASGDAPGRHLSACLPPAIHPRIEPEENTGHVGPSSRVIADSISPWGDRVTTVEVRLHRFVLSELNTHRAFSTLIGHALVAPVEHREGVVQDYTEVEYLDLQRFIYRFGRAMVEVLPTERLYVLSIGSQQGNRHLHWHVASMPPGVPYLEQQFEALKIETNGYLDIPRADLARLASELRRARGPIAG